MNRENETGSVTCTQQIITETEKVVLHTYNRYPVALESGEGVYLTDVEGKKYLDFGAGIAVFALGYGNRAYNEAVKGQVDALIHTSNLFYHKPLMEAAGKLAAASAMQGCRVFFTNSGTEAIEGAIKAARKYAWLKDHKNDHEIIAMQHSFHGRSIGALSVTGNDHYQEAFRPLMGGVRFASFNDLESVRSQVNEKTCAIILETVQGEGGIYPADPAFLAGVKAICEEQDILLILDEIQCGMGRCGDYFAWQGYGIEPDIMTCAKALGCGVPVGAFVLNAKTAGASLVPGDHGTTYGGNPLACAAVSAVFDQYEALDVIGHVREIAPYLEAQLENLIKDETYGKYLAARRGKGLMQGVVVKDIPVGQIVQAALKEGLILMSAGSDVLRFVPPLVITEKDVDEMIVRLKAAIDTLL